VTADAGANPEVNDGGEQWDDEALAATMTRKGAVAKTDTAELLDMKALDLNRNETGDRAERLRVDETKAKLAAAREGMEKEAQRLKEQKEKKEEDKQAGVTPTNNKPRFGNAAAGMAAGGGKWKPPHMRAGGGALMGGMGGSRFGNVGGGLHKVDTEDENLFPDLATASAIIEKQKQQGPAYKVHKKTPVGGGATWGSRPKVQLKKEEPKPEEPKAAEPEIASPPPSAEPAPAPTPSEPVVAPKPIKPKKKKKKDLSTFKA
jgi:hypothetical protein